MKWNEGTIRSFEEASDFTKFHENLSRYIRPLLKDCKKLCDIGCGLGLVDMYLKDYINEITCVDINKDVINHLQNQIEVKNINNIKCYVEDYRNIEEFFDVILISFFGYEDFDFFATHCKQLIAIVNDRVSCHLPMSSSKAESLKKHSSDHLEKLLIKNKIKYTVEKHSLEFGQIFNDKQDIENYAKYYDEGNQYEEIYNHIKNNVKKEGEKSYYLPYKKKFSIFTIEF